MLFWYDVQVQFIKRHSPNENQKLFDLAKNPATVKIGNVTAHNIIGVVGGVGNKHADLVFISDQRPFEEIFLSYKSMPNLFHEEVRQSRFSTYVHQLDCFWKL